MAIGKISGVMLQSDLQRQGVNLTFDSNLVYLDVNNRYVGINTTTPTSALTVNGNIIADNLSANISGNTTVSGNVTINGTVLKVPTGNTSQEPAGAPVGSIRFNTDTSSLEYYTGSSWITTNSQVDDQVITPDGTSYTYTLNHSSSTGGVLVMLNGVVQTPSTAYTVTADQITFTEIPLTTDKIEVRFISGGLAPAQNIIADPTATYVNSTNVSIDHYDLTVYRTSKYLLQVSDSANVHYQSSEVLVTHNGTIANVSTTHNINTNSTLVTFSANVSGGNVNLLATSTGANCAVKLQKTYIKV